MQPQPSVLIISSQQAMQLLTQRVCKCAGAQTMTATSEQEATAIAVQRGLHNFALVVMDTALSGQDTLSPPRRACQLLQEWTAASPLLPFVFISPVAHKPALMRIRADIVRFVTTPFGEPVLLETIEACLPSTAQRARRFSTQFSKKGMSNGAYHHRSNYHRVSWRDAAVRDGVASGAFSAAGSDQNGMVPHN